MEIYKSKADYSRKTWIHVQTANKRETNKTLEKITINGSKVWYIDIFEANLILAQLIKR